MFNWKTKEEREFKARWEELKGDRDIRIIDSPDCTGIIGRENFDGYSIIVKAEDIEGIILELDKKISEMNREEKSEMNREEKNKRANARVAIRTTGVILANTIRTVDVVQTWSDWLEDYYWAENKMDLFDLDIITEELHTMAFNMASPNSKVVTIRYTVMMENRIVVMNSEKIYKKDLV